MAKRKQIAIGDKYYSDGVECRVINIYDKTFAVRSDYGSGVVRFSDMKLVRSLRSENNTGVRKSKYWL